MNRPKVSVSLITYNHEKYIAACLDSIISQRTGFEFEIVVSDDCSTDRTPEIINTYVSKYPDLIVPVLRKTNLGMVKNALDTMKTCRGQYIAIMEGDDYWADDTKLQQQAVFLDNNPDCALCFTNGFTFFENEPGKKKFFYTGSDNPPKKFNLDYLLANNVVIPNNTKMFRSDAQPSSFPDWMYNSINWDWVLHVLQASKGQIGYIDIIALAYRRHDDAAFTLKGETDVLLSGINTITALNKYLNYKYDGVFKSLWWEFRELSFVYLKKKELVLFLKYYLKYLSAIDKWSKINVRDELWRIRTTLMATNK